jgi:predicted RND superfamily exporter protein
MIPQRWIEAYLRFLLRHRAAVTASVVALTVLFAWALSGLRLHTEFVDFYPRRHPYIQLYNEFRAMFGTPNIMSVIVEVKSGDIYNPDTLAKLDRVTKFMIYTRGVVPYQITSIAHPKVRTAIAGAGGSVTIREIFYPRVPETTEEAERVRFRVYSNPSIRGIYTASDDTAAVVHTAFWEEALDFAYLHDRMMELKRTEEDERHRIHVTGFPWLYASVLLYAREVGYVFGLTALSLAFLLYAYFRSGTGVWVPLFSGLLSSVWGLGLAALLGFNVDPLVLVIPVFLTARALSHSVQSMDRYHEEYHRLGDKREAIVISYAHLFPPAIASIVTDGMALLVVAVAPIPLVQKVAIFASFWVVSIFVSVVTLHPILLSYLRPPGRRRRSRQPPLSFRAGTALVFFGSAAVVGAALAAGLSGFAALISLLPVLGGYWLVYSEHIYALVTRRVIRSTQGAGRWVVIAAALLLGLLLPMWGWQLKVGDMTPGAALLFAEHPYNVAYRILNEKFLGASQLIVVADTHKPDGIKGEEALLAIDEFADHMSSAKGARGSVSIVDVVKQSGRMWHDGDPKWGIIPGDLRERTELLFVFNMVASGDLDRFVDRSGRFASIITLFNDHSHDVIKRAIDWATRFEGADGAVRFRHAAGLFGILAAVNESVESSYWLNLAMIFAIVYACLYLTYGSWVASAILMIPVVLSQLAAEAAMVLMRIDLNVNSLPVAAAGAGVGIDYGIYHFSRMIDAYDEVGQLDEAVDYATATTGKAIIFTASTMIAGTVFWWFSHLKFLAEMGLLLALLMLFNTFGGLVVVPALVKTLRPRFLTGRSRSGQ